MIGGTYFVATGTVPGWVWIASLPYAILVTTVLMGKHIDKIAADAPMGIRTLPVILGERNARLLNSALMIAFYPIVLGAAAVGWIGPWVAIVVLGLPRLWAVLKVYAADRPTQAPPGWVLWPLWYVSFAFIHTRRAGALLVVGLFLNIVLPVKLPWLAG
jgi:1,4-dihydroxy-2-naphthoate octaprenyltransferase